MKPLRSGSHRKYLYWPRTDHQTLPLRSIGRNAIGGSSRPRARLRRRLSQFVFFRFGRFVEMIPKLCPFKTKTTLPSTGPVVNMNNADVPSVTLSRVCVMKSSSMP